MATENNLVLNMPFDESDGSTVAHDYSSNRYDATLTGGRFLLGQQGNYIHFDGSSYAEIAKDILTISARWTLIAWVKPTLLADGISRRVGLFCNTDQLYGSRVLWMDAVTNSWTLMVIRKRGTTVSISTNYESVGSVELPGELTGFSIIQDIYGSEYAYADLDEVQLYNEVLTDEEVRDVVSSQLTNNTASDIKINYYLNGVNLQDYGIRVSASTGVIDHPKLKTPTSVDWPDYNGKVIDLSDKRFEEREISLSCWIKASGKMDFANKLNKFYEIFQQDGTQRLLIGIHPRKPLVFEVYCEDGIAVSKRWHNDLMIGTFTLKLKEPDPVKRVVRHQKQGTTGTELTIGCKTDKMTDIYWGDGTVDKDVYGDHTGNNVLHHTYTNDGIYYAIVGGIIEDLQNFTTNGIIVWNKL